MNSKIIGILIPLTLFSFTAIIAQEESKPKTEVASLSELQQLKAENFQLKVQLAQCSATVADRENRLKSVELSSEQLKLEKEFREQLHAKETDKFDWTNLSFTPITK